MQQTTLDHWHRAFRQIVQPPHFTSLVEFAQAHIELPPCLTLTGKFNADISPHFLKPMEALDNEEVRKVVLGKPVRGGGTLIADLWHISNLVRDPGPTMAIFHDDRVSREHSQSRYMPMLQLCDLTKHLLPTDARKMNYQAPHFSNGVPWWISGPAIGRLQAKGVRYLSLDEIWRIEPGVITEAMARLGDFQRMGLDKCLITSQAGEEGDVFDEQFHQGNVQEWAVDCPACKKTSIVGWVNLREDGTFWGLKWDSTKDDRGFHRPEAAAQTVRYSCEWCDKESDEETCKAHWQTNGRYIAQNEAADESIESFRWTAIIDFPWRLLVAEFLHAKNASKIGDLTALIKFYQKRMVEPKSEGSVIGGTENFVREIYDVQSEWEQEHCRIISVDVQGESVFWVSVRAWAINGESRRLYFGKAYGFAECEALRIEHKVPKGGAFIDAGYNPKGVNGVYWFTISHPGWIPLKGVALAGGGEKEFVHSVRKRVGNKLELKRVRRPYSEPVPGDPEVAMPGRAKRFASFINFSAPTMKNATSRLIDIGKWIEPQVSGNDELEKEYRAQMSAEVKKTSKHRVTGITTSYWKVLRRDNHAFDLASMQCLGALLNKVDLAAD